MNRSDALARLTGCRVARLATTTPRGEPHVVPITFALVGNAIVTMVDHKPKTTERLQRLINLEAHSGASVLADHYSEDWSELWWVRVDGQAVIHDGDDLWVEGRAALAEKYSQYEARPPEGPAIEISIDRITSWAGTP